MATTVKKGAKINFYKFVSPKTEGAQGSDANPSLTNSLRGNVRAVNNLGKTVNSIGKVVVSIKKTTHQQLIEQRKNRVKFKPLYNKPLKKGSMTSFFKKMSTGRVPGFLESLLNLLASLFKFFIGRAILKWLANPENQEKVRKGIEVIGKMLKIVASWAKFGTNMAFNGLYEMLADDSTWWERLVGFGKFIIGIGTLLLPLRWLTIGGVGRLVADLKGSIALVKTAIVGIKAWVATAAAGPLAFLFVAGGVAAMAALLNKLWNQRDRVDAVLEADDAKRQKLIEEGMEPGDAEALVQGTSIPDAGGSGSFNNLPDRFNDPLGLRNDPLGGGFGMNKFSFANGGKLQEFANGGGWIHGSQKGYPVSLDGGGVPDFIGHGTEYVARKGDGTAFIVPFDTKATRVNPNLTHTRLKEAKSMGYDLSGLEKASGGGLDKKIYLHWTGTGYNFKKKGNYHSIFQGSGEKFQASPYDTPQNHTPGRNDNSVGLAAASMAGRPYIDYPPKGAQMTAMMKEAARIAMGWGWTPRDVSRKRVMTAGEAASNKDGVRATDNYGPVVWGGTGERTDFFKTRKNAPDGSGGNELRRMMMNFMNAREKRKEGSESKDRNVEMNLLQRLVLAEAANQGDVGMALVARSVLNRQGIINSGASPGLFNSKSGSLTDIINGSGQYQPVKDGSINRKFSQMEMERAAKAIGLAQNSSALRSRLIAAGYDESVVNKLLGATGFRTKAAFEDKSQNVNRTKHGDHIFNTAGNKDLNVLWPERNKKYGGGAGGGAGTFKDKSTREGRSSLLDILTGGGGGATSNRGAGGGARDNRVSDRRSGSMDASTAGKIKKQTDDRNRARKEMNRRTLEVVQAALTAIEQQNASSRSWVQQANATASAVLGQADTPITVSGGGGGGGGGFAGPFQSSGANNIFGIATSVLNSFNNPLRGLFR